ncbi:ubiquitin 3 binding protein But2 C-terminal domain-containing protein [Ampelomyces quisqualis]|uniref:Ubiquitin 3 binding protein But2 C-terminal domain-containing protein n=1 Tax=Ampelomyces quisqualis TaxID=50730 RepID=A0A6A5QVV0_AMPQU|nr:ubiquitin 3 binding protein But2 C-terminal domain-containing protein [Ampelomyces quisqualis]
MRIPTLFPMIFALGAVAELEFTDFPHLIIPLNSSAPDTHYGTQNSGIISNSVFTEISFDVRPDIPANICRLNFHLNLNPSKNAPWSIEGAPFTFIISRIKSEIDKDKDTWNKYPPVMHYLANVTVDKDGNVTVEDGWFQCPKGGVAQFLLWPSSDADVELTWFELDYGWEIGGPHGVTLEMHS